MRNEWITEVLEHPENYPEEQWQAAYDLFHNVVDGSEEMK